MLNKRNDNLCGLVGMVGWIGPKEKAAMKLLTYFDIIRGEHSTGYAVLSSDDEISVMKEVGPPGFLFTREEFTEKGVLKETMPKFIMGHNRYATAGAINAGNAHPFICGDIVGCHNGTLNTENLKDLPDYDKYEVDSEALFSSINQIGLKETINLTAKAWSLTFYNKKDNTLNFIRNDERPMCYVWSADKRTMFWASESWMLKQALAAVKLPVEDTIYVTSVDMHYSIDLSKSYFTKEACFNRAGIIQGAKPKYPKYVSSNTYWGGRGSTYYKPVTKDNVIDKRNAFSKNVVLAPPKNKSDFIDMVLSDQEVVFTGEHTIHGHCYTYGYATDNADLEIRAYDSPHNIYGYVFGEPYMGFVKKIKTDRVTGQVYAILDLKTIVELEDARTYPIDNGELVTLTEWEDSTKKGCAHCCVQPDDKDADECVWMNEKTFLCKDCVTNPAIAGYIN